MNEYESLSLFWNKLTLLVLFLTLVVLAIYTWFTKKIHDSSGKQLEELIRQRRLGIMPSIVLLGQNSQLQITNVGNGPAVNVKVKPLLPSEEELEKIVDKFAVEFDQISLLRPGERKTVTFRINGVASHDDGQSLFVQELLIDVAKSKGRQVDFEVVSSVEFYDIERAFYKQPLSKTEEDLSKTEEDFWHGFVKLIEEGQGATLIAQEK